jgi:hypothetical protein
LPIRHASSIWWLLKFAHSHSTPFKQPIHKKILVFTPPKAARTQEIK